MKLEDKSYLMRLGENIYIDAKNPIVTEKRNDDDSFDIKSKGIEEEIKARYINDCRNKNGYNVEFIKLPSEKKALIRAIRDIEINEELFVDYGKWYWASIKGNRLTNEQLIEIRHITKDKLRQEIEERLRVKEEAEKDDDQLKNQEIILSSTGQEGIAEL